MIGIGLGIPWGGRRPAGGGGGGVAPANTTPASITGSQPVGSTLTRVAGVWTGTPAPTVTWVWRRGGSTTVQTGGATYVSQAGDAGQAIDLLETADNGVGAPVQQASSNAVTVGTAPAFSVAPTTTGTVSIGNVLGGTDGTVTGTPTPTLAYQWKRNGVAISGETGASYTCVAADVQQGVSLRRDVTATNALGAAPGTSSNSLSWSAANFGTIALNLDIDQITGAADGVQQTTWNDVSGNGRDASGSGGARPTYRATSWPGGLPCLQWDGVDDIMSTAAFGITTGLIIVVAKLTTAAVLVEHSTNAGSGANGTLFYGTISVSSYWKRASVASGKEVASAWAAGDVARVMASEIDGTHANHAVYNNSLTAASTTNATGATSNPGTGSTSQALYIGARAGSLLRSAGLFRNVMVVSPVPTAANRAALLRDLGARAGLTIT